MSDRLQNVYHRLKSKRNPELDTQHNTSVFLPVDLPCGRSVRNRLVKVSMYEHLATFLGGPPNQYHFALYSVWAAHKWGMIMTGNVQVTPDHLTLGRDMVLPPEITQNSLEPYQKLAASMHGLSSNSPEMRDFTQPMPLAIMQLNHAGRQSSNFIGGRFPFLRPLAPSPIPVGARNQNSTMISSIFHRILFQRPKAMSLDDLEYVISRFVDGARLAHEAGFDGIQLHAAHGYLLAQFISPKSNTRTDSFSATRDNDLRLLRTIVSRIRAAVPTSFILGIKLSAADYSANATTTEVPRSLSEEQALHHIISIAQWGGIDFIEISGGDYENPEFVASVSTSARQAFFSRFSHNAVQALEKMPRRVDSPPPPLILLTGGFRTPALINAALSANHAHLLGIGRGSVLSPDLPTILEHLDEHSQWSKVPFRPEPRLSKPQFLQSWPFIWFWAFLPKVPLIGAGVGVAWYVVTIRYLAQDAAKNMEVRPNPDYSLGGLGAVIWMWVWLPWKLVRTRSKQYGFIFVTTVLLALFFDLLIMN